jgi:uncharacterized phage protein gp47/JayE
MIDLGKPFSEAYKDIIDALEDRVRNGVEQPDRVQFTYKGTVSSYELPRQAYAITRVTGVVGGPGGRGQFFEFVPDRDFRFGNNRIIWREGEGAEQPREGSRFEVEYTYRERPAGLTDFNPGSVVGTLVRAVARQMKLIYDQMDEAYRRAFIGEATGAALDNVVALLGVTRNPPLSAKGEVTFFLRGATDSPVVIPADTRVADESGRTFRTIEEGVIPQEKDEFRVQSDGVLRVTDRVAELVGIWLREVDPDPELELATEDPPVSEEDERTITLADGVTPEGQLRVRYRPKSVTVPIEAVQPGPEGNVNAETIVIMPTPPRGVDGVVNEEPVTGGVLPEPDDQLRERAKHALEQAGNATLNAIRFGVLDVDGVEGVEIIDRSVDATVHLGEVRVRYFGGARTEVAQAVEETRAAGVLVKLDEIEQVLVSGVFYLIPDPDAPSNAVSQFLSAVVEIVNSLAIGEPLSIRRLNALVYDVSVLADVAEAQLVHDRGGNAGQPVTDPLLIGPTELVRPDVSNLGAVLVSALRVAASRRVGTGNELDLQLLDADGNPIEWRNFSLDLTVTLLARRQSTPGQPPVRVGSLTKTATWNDANTATLTITPDDIASLQPSYRPEEHLPEVNVVVAAAAFPGILNAEDATIDLTGT